MKELSRIPKGSKGTVRELMGGHAFHSRVVSMGLTVGSKIEVIQHAGRRKGPMLIASGSTRLALGHGMAAKIVVEVTKE